MKTLAGITARLLAVVLVVFGLQCLQHKDWNGVIDLLFGIWVGVGSRETISCE
jgi:hypothetical protein